jgi:hypothetical protein
MNWEVTRDAYKILFGEVEERERERKSWEGG